MEVHFRQFKAYRSSNVYQVTPLFQTLSRCQTWALKNRIDVCWKISHFTHRSWNGITTIMSTPACPLFQIMNDVTSLMRSSSMSLHTNFLIRERLSLMKAYKVDCSKKESDWSIGLHTELPMYICTWICSLNSDPANIMKGWQILNWTPIL